MTFPGTTVRIGVLRSRYGGAQSAEATIAALGLPAADVGRSVLIIRKVALIGGDSRHAHALLRELRQRANRPASGAVDPRADAVVFCDEIELLTCLCRDMAAGCVAERWYWQYLSQGASPGLRSPQAVAWTRMARWLPAALTALQATEAARAVARLSPAEAAEVSGALLTVYSISMPEIPHRSPGAHAIRIDTEPGRGNERPDPLTIPETSQATASAPVGPRGAQAASWLPSLPSAAAALEPAAQLLLGLALTLGPAPERRLDPRLGNAMRAWLSDTPRWNPPFSQPTHIVAAAHRGPAAAIHRDRSDRGAGHNLTDENVLTDKNVEAPKQNQSQHSPARGHESLVDARTGDTGSWPDARTPTADTTAPRLDPGAENLGPDAISPWPDDAEAISSSIASALYLVNVLCWLGLPDPQLSGQLSGWAVLDLLARHLLSAELPEVSGDPLWALLAILDGRPEDEPPSVPDGELILPRSWLRQWHPGPPGWQSDVEPGRTAGQPWLNAVGGFASWLLRSRGVGPAALRQSGLVCLTRTHLDVFLDIEHIDINARRSGLDRDPGWVPSLARIVSFHFGAQD